MRLKTGDPGGLTSLNVRLSHARFGRIRPMPGKPNGKPALFFSHQAIRPWRAKPESARGTMRGGGPPFRERQWRGADRTGPACLPRALSRRQTAQRMNLDMLIPGFPRVQRQIPGPAPRIAFDAPADRFKDFMRSAQTRWSRQSRAVAGAEWIPGEANRSRR